MSVSKCFTDISFDYKYLIQKVIIDVHHYNAIGRSMRRYVICCNNYVPIHVTIFVYLHTFCL